MYDFHKVKHDAEDNEWKHKYFRRDKPELLHEIKRKLSENNGTNSDL